MSLKNSLKKIIYANQTGKHEKFVEGIREIISAERKRGHNRVADELERTLADATGLHASYQPQPMRQLTSSANLLSGSQAIPVSKGDNLPLVEVRNPHLTYDDVVLSKKTKSRTDRIVNEHINRTSFTKYGLQPVKSVLFYGPPGCGKTLTAHVLAGVLGWSLLYTRFDSVISSYLGETSINLRRVFDFAEQGPCILFFDEFDAIGKTREERSDVGELKRVVNAFLQLMENYKGNGLIIASTNHEQLLDDAIWRRFDEVVCFGRPATKEIEIILRKRLAGVRLYDFSLNDVISQFKNLTYSDITHICIDAIKHMVLSDRASLTEKDLISALTNFKENRPSL